VAGNGTEEGTAVAISIIVPLSITPLEVELVPGSMKAIRAKEWSTVRFWFRQLPVASQYWSDIPPLPPKKLFEANSRSEPPLPLKLKNSPVAVAVNAFPVRVIVEFDGEAGELILAG
jgi:hypothetical protein